MDAVGSAAQEGQDVGRQLQGLREGSSCERDSEQRSHQRQTSASLQYRLSTRPRLSRYKPAKTAWASRRLCP